MTAQMFFEKEIEQDAEEEQEGVEEYEEDEDKTMDAFDCRFCDNHIKGKAEKRAPEGAKKG